MPRCTKKRDSHSAIPFFCIVKLFGLLHFQEFARGGGRAPFLSSSHPLPADNAIERLNKKPHRSSRFLGKRTRERVAKAPDFCYHIGKRSGRKRRPYLIEWHRYFLPSSISHLSASGFPTPSWVRAGPSFMWNSMCPSPIWGSSQ